MALGRGLKTLLHRHVGEEDLRVATNVANRNRAGHEGLIGPLVNTVILRTDLGDDPTPREVMRRVRATTLDAYAHQDLPFEELAETLLRDRARPQPEALPGDDFVAQCCTAAGGELRTGARFRGSRSEHVDAAGDDHNL